MDVSRRDILRSGAVLAAGVVAGAGLMVAGCSSEGSDNTSSQSAGDTTTWDFEYDVVVVGSGYAGLCAAVEAKTAGAETVVLEKHAQPGGNSIQCGGVIMAGGGTSVQRASGVEETADDYYNSLIVTHYRGEPALLRKWAEGAPSLIDWLEDLGLEWSPEIGEAGRHNPAAGDYPGIIKHSTGGIASWTVINREATRLGIETLLNHKAVKLVQREDGTILGVEAEANGSTLRFKARKAVVLGCGGFKNNRPMRSNWDPRVDDDVSASGFPYVDTQGEMVRAAIEAGAAQKDMSFVCEYRARWGTDRYQYWEPTTIETVPDPETGFRISDYNQVIIVKNDGKRFVDESKGDSNSAFPDACLNVQERPRNIWLIADKNIADNQEWDVDSLNNPDPATLPYISPDRIAVADTLEDLASQMNIDAAALKEEITRYNGFVDKGEDEDFEKEELTHKIETAPFYAMKAILFGHDQQSGISVNTLGQVIADASMNGTELKALDDREVIPHLYAAGETCAGYYGEARGSSKIGVIMFWGRNAGQNAAQESEIV